MTQQELAERLGVAKQQVQRDEATAYGSASLSRIAEVLRVLHVQMRPTVACISVRA